MGVLISLLLASLPHQPADADRDGFPDAAELGTGSDRNNFRRWFTSIALSRYLEPSGKITDCAGLVCYAYREALKEHSASWRNNIGNLTDQTIPEIEAFSYPKVPYIGTDIFRLAQGVYKDEDRKEGKLGNFADTEHLMNHHTFHLCRDHGEGVLPGDLLFFTPRDVASHVMIYTEIEGESYLVYHTGPGEEGEKGEMRLVRFETLLAIEDETWRPVVDNPEFAGFSRFKILD